jgi:hypothetical protein
LSGCYGTADAKIIINETKISVGFPEDREFEGNFDYLVVDINNTDYAIVNTVGPAGMPVIELPHEGGYYISAVEYTESLGKYFILYYQTNFDYGNWKGVFIDLNGKRLCREFIFNDFDPNIYVCYSNKIYTIANSSLILYEYKDEIKEVRRWDISKYMKSVNNNLSIVLYEKTVAILNEKTEICRFDSDNK